MNEADGGLFPSCNLAVSREAYEAVGGFDRDAGGRLGFQTSHRARGLGFGEDTIFGWRVARRFEVAYDDRMLVHHVVLPADLRDWLGRSWQMAAFPALVREVPELQSTGLVRRGFLFSHRSRAPVYVFALTLLTRRPGLIAAAAVWWAAHRFQATLRRQPLSITDRARALPAQLVLDAVQAAALATGSVRARKLLL